jgi:hypothetical protein
MINELRKRDEFGFLDEKAISICFAQRSRHSCRLRINPLDLYEINLKIGMIRENHRTVRVLLFCGTWSSVRTKEEVIEAISDAGADEVYSFSLVDRTRFPTDKGVKSRAPFRSHSSLWRFDIDSLASSRGAGPTPGCMLCDVADAIERRLEALPRRATNVRERLIEWLEIARVQTLTKSSALAGVITRRLPRIQSVSFGIDVADPTKHREKISCFYNSSLTSIVLEIVTMTGNHDLPLKMIEKLENDVRSNEDKKYSNHAALVLACVSIILLKSDVDYRRRLLLFRTLLRLLACSREISDSTAFAGIVISSADVSIARGLSQDLELLMREKAQNASIDLLLAASILSKRTRMVEGNRLIESVGGLTALQDRSDFVYSLRELMLLLGLRRGDSHFTKLHHLLSRAAKNDSIDDGETKAIKALFELLIYHLDYISATGEAFLIGDSPRCESKLDRLPRGSIESLKSLIEGTKTALIEFVEMKSRQNFSPKIVQIITFLYGGYNERRNRLGLRDVLRNAISIRPLGLRAVVNDTLQTSEVVNSRIRSLDPSREFGRLDGYAPFFELCEEPRVDAETNEKNTVFYTSQIQIAIREQFDNAVKYCDDGGFDAGHNKRPTLVRWYVSLSRDGLLVRIENRLRDAPTRMPKPTLSTVHLEQLNGKVAHDWHDGIFISELLLPFLTTVLR